MGYFKGKQFKKDIILVAVGYYCRFSLSYRDVSEILNERGISGFWCKNSGIWKEEKRFRCKV